MTIDSDVDIASGRDRVAEQWRDPLLYNQTAKRPMAAMVGLKDTVVADVPYRRGP